MLTIANMLVRGNRTAFKSYSFNARHLAMLFAVSDKLALRYTPTQAILSFLLIFKLPLPQGINRRGFVDVYSILVIRCIAERRLNLWLIVGVISQRGFFLWHLYSAIFRAIFRGKSNHHFLFGLGLVHFEYFWLFGSLSVGVDFIIATASLFILD